MKYGILPSKEHYGKKISYDLVECSPMLNKYGSKIYYIIKVIISSGEIFYTHKDQYLAVEFSQEFPTDLFTYFFENEFCKLFDADSDEEARLRFELEKYE